MYKALLLLAALVLLGCTGEKSQTGRSGFQTRSEKRVDKLFAAHLIFNIDTVYRLLERANRDQVTKSRQLFMQALDQYVNQKNPAASIPLFRESILYYPDLKTYNYLANAYIDIMDTVRADSALVTYDMGDYEVEYTMARLYAVRNDTASAISSLASAFSNGFSNKKRFENDPVFNYLRNERGFIALVVTYLKNDTRLLESLFKSFLATAPELRLPFSFTKDSLLITNYEGIYRNPSINYDFAPFISGMEDSRFSRDVSNDYFMVGKLPLDGGRKAVLYKSVVVIADTLPPVEIKMAIFDSLGNLIEEKMFAQYTLPETLITGLIDENKSVIIREYKMKWKTDPLENGYAGNEYAGEDLLTEARYVFGSDGRLAVRDVKDNVMAKQ
jgi:hypothetical protein